MNTQNIRKICYGGLIIALAVLLPQAFHLFAGPVGGKLFLPMHLPILLGGFALGWKFGLTIGLFAPVISSLLTGMPDPSRLPFMVLELGAYGFAAGFLYYALNLRKKRIIGTYVSLIGAMLFGRLIYMVAVSIATYLMNIPAGGIMAVVSATMGGIYGIILQILFIPAIVYALERSGFLERYNKSKAISG